MTILAAFTLLAGCASAGTTTARPPEAPKPSAVAPPPPPAPAVAAAPATLYDRLGGKDAITAVIGEFLSRVAADDRINARFSNADLPRLKGLLIEFVCEATGGPCKYTGRDMHTAHAGMRLASSEFDALVENLKGALDHFKVPAREEGELLGALGPLKPQIVQEDGLTPVAEAAGKDPVLERAKAVRGAAGLLEKANQARLAGNRSLADQLFTSAEIIVGTPAVADLIPLFREGAPPRVTTALRTVAKDAAPQPAAVGSSEEDGDKKATGRGGSLSGTVMLPGQRPLPGIAVITLEPASGKFPHRTPKQRVIEQRNREFAPKVLAVPVGSTVSFPNFDNIYHNVFSRSRARSFDLGMYKAGQARELTFDKEGLIRIGCNLHANMSAYVVSVAAPHYVVSEPGGKFNFRSLRPGRYRLRAWVENNDAPAVQDIEIKRDANTVAVTLSSEGAAQPQTDKFGVPHGDPSHK
ncbi:MAG TPA: hypothetical protein VHU40_09775 [Polyangia bacterium]|nr:hypothetical protein [Polyangia bacterium]